MLNFENVENDESMLNDMKLQLETGSMLKLWK